MRSGILAALTGALLLAATAFTPAGAPSASGATASVPILGLLGATAPNFQSEQQAGVGAVTIQVGWDSAEPTPDTLSSSYLSQVEGRIASARQSGLSVVLDPGLQYPPQWVLAIPDSRFKNQYGDTFSGSEPSGNNVVNAFTNMNVRAAEGTYLADLGQALGPSGLLAVRGGGGPLGELRYPGPDYNGHTGSFWAYDAGAQAGLPVPLRGWTPGTGSTADAAAFLAAYNQKADAYGVWLNGQLHADFGVKELLLLPGWGQRPDSPSNSPSTDEITARLAPANERNEYNEGLDWVDLLDALPYPSTTVAYTTYLDAQTVLPTPQLEGPADFLASLVAGTSIQLGGENSGKPTDTPTTVAFCMATAERLGFFIVQWMGEPQLLAAAAGSNPGGPTLAQLAASFASATAPTAQPPPGGGAGVVSVATASLPPARQNHPYSASLAADSTAPVTSWSITAGTLPAGLHLDGSTGAISGSPTVAGVVVFTVRVENSAGLSASAVLTLPVVADTATPGLVAAAVGMAATPDGGGYWIAAAAGEVVPFGDAGDFGSMAGRPLNSPINHIVATPDGLGYWLVAADGGIFTFGDAHFFGSMGGRHLNAPVVDLAPTADGLGYWLVASDGGIFTFGDAPFRGSMGGSHLNRPVVGITADDATTGYWLVASDGGVFAFAAPFFGSTGGLRLHLPIDGMASTPGGKGYWFVASDGGIFAFGDAGFHGSTGAVRLNGPIVGMAADSATGGYWLVGSDGGIFSFTAPFLGAA